MRKTLICSLIGLVRCTWMAGCQDKPDGAQTIIIELADPSDQVEETKNLRTSRLVRMIRLSVCCWKM